MTFPPIHAYCYKPRLSFRKKIEITMLHQGSWFSSLMILSAIFSLTSLMLKSEGANHTVGDSSGWELLTNYTNWTQGREFHVGDVLGNFPNSQGFLLIALL